MTSLLQPTRAEASASGEASPPKVPSGSSPTPPLIPVDRRQIANTLSFVDSTVGEPAKRQLFERLGYEHVTDPGFREAMTRWRDDLQGYFDRINSGRDTYWERMEYIREPASVRVVGKPVTRCACPYAQTERPAKSLCHYCCRNFQQCMFEFLLQRPVRVRIDEAFLLGGTRCSTTIFFDGELEHVAACDA